MIINSSSNYNYTPNRSNYGSATCIMLGGVDDIDNETNSTKYYTTTTTTLIQCGQDPKNRSTATRVLETRHYYPNSDFGASGKLGLTVTVPIPGSNIVTVNGEQEVGFGKIWTELELETVPGNLEIVPGTVETKLGSLESVQEMPEKVYAMSGSKFKEIDKDGQEIPRKPGHPEVQDYDKIKAECLKSGKLFQDSQFPAEDSSLFFSEAERIPNVEWKRPKEFSSNPKFFIDGFSRFDVNQGELGNCWFLAAVANLTLHDDIFSQVVPNDNSFVEDYCGAFHFRFWHYGAWVDVVVDDLLPCRKDTGQPIFMHSVENEFWSALLEKAYAKLYGSYQALSGGTATEALQDFTGGLIETIQIKESKLDIFSVMETAQERQSFMGCSLAATNPDVIEGKTDQGLVRGHAYSVTRVQKVDIITPNKTGKIPLVRIRNPWGNEFEWKGAWSDGSREWQFVPESTKQQLGLNFHADGEFWMSFKDFREQFDTLEICYLTPNSLVSIPNGVKDAETKRQWHTSVYEGKWTTGATSGGCVNYILLEPRTFAHNPQYIVNVSSPPDSKSTLLVALMQKHRRAKKKDGAGCLSIGFTVYQLKDVTATPNPLNLSWFRYNKMVGDSGNFINAREISGRFELGPGSYCIIPSTFQPNEDGDFMIRVFSEQLNPMKENNGQLEVGKVDSLVENNSTKTEAEGSDEIQQLFRKLSGQELEISWTKLKSLLDSYLQQKYNLDGLSREVCRSMVAMFDADRTGKLGLEEFTILWKNILIWMSCFKIYDADSSGNLSSLELRTALGSIGYQVNNNVLAAIVLRYGDESGNISLEDFIMVAVKLKSLIESYKEQDPDGSNSVCFTMENWVEKNIYS